jgi:hypothetical protein
VCERERRREREIERECMCEREGGRDREKVCVRENIVHLKDRRTFIRFMSFSFTLFRWKKCCNFSAKIRLRIYIWLKMQMIVLISRVTLYS